MFNEKGNEDLDVPRPAELGPAYPSPPKDKKNLAAYREYLKQKQNVDKVRAEMHSLWCTELYRLSIANMYRDKVTIREIIAFILLHFILPSFYECQYRFFLT